MKLSLLITTREAADWSKPRLGAAAKFDQQSAATHSSVRADGENTGLNTPTGSFETR